MGNMCGSGDGAGGGSSAPSEVLFFPDANMPCKYYPDCRRANCNFSHTPTSLGRILHILHGAKRSLDICVFTITCNEIADAIVDAHRRGVTVRIISDDQQSRTQGSDIGRFFSERIPTRLDRSPAHMHHKFAIIDGRTLLNGSFNWTRQGVLQNNENVVISQEGALIRQFGGKFEALWTQYA